jgi:hypothetical protein
MGKYPINIHPDVICLIPAVANQRYHGLSPPIQL